MTGGVARLFPFERPTRTRTQSRAEKSGSGGGEAFGQSHLVKHLPVTTMA